ncbi:hypothetical protein TTHERM_000193899 (macronuclear) [Tetrahymena thermophila SB210]|uniref:Uncharacterized protein n=1 Tax=Tetrahymena thermophila (strain SB210) TaxID=312017 RepID=W7XC61_TETTS|nr:hypothetical protein TTHERM_000193899 [Tetrahymena thermophila SB210]EWS74098.1 hypothetical protein TTHERM_000193899 [Tetrahymena thermophila SB210]|eukprot:XP_012653353.1 hypothetical protein TTHERM_000193899 [Tetrahymena thermophila SB210]
MISFSKGTFKVIEPVLATLKYKLENGLPQFIVKHYTDVVLNPLQYEVKYTVDENSAIEEEIEQQQYKSIQLKLDFTYLVEATSTQKQIMNNFGVVQVNEFKSRIPVIVSKENDDLCITFL